MRHSLRMAVGLALAPIMVLSTFVTAQAGTRSESKTYDSDALTDCGRVPSTRPSGLNRTEVCFDIQTGDQTLDLIISDNIDFPIAAFVYFEDANNNFVASRGTTQHTLCGRGESQRDTSGQTVGLNSVVHYPLFLVPSGATKVLVYLGRDSLTWNLGIHPVSECLLSGRPGHSGTTGTIEAIFDGG